ncbi:MAG: rhomboid family intramembrane serine protease [Sphingobacteriales bacterium]|nr:rhomboid family intramembrane serine protease [Sphingobacteriales bacterium]
MPYTEPSYKQRISLGQSNNALTRLILINLVIFISLALAKVFYYYLYREEAQVSARFNSEVLPLAVLPASLSELANRPWTVLTSMFTHIGVWMTLANMLWLWTFGYIMQDLTGNRKIVPLYIYGGLAGVIAFLLAVNLLPAAQGQASSVYYGSAASITAIAVAITLVSPGYRIFPLLNGGFPLWILTAFYLLVSIATLPYYRVEAYAPPVAGALTGFLFIWFIRRGYDWSEWMSHFFDWVNNLFNPDKPRKGQPALKDQLFYKSHSAPYKKTPHLTPQRIDEILDKINQQGYNSLSAEEKDLLRRAGEDDVQV